MPSTYTLNNGIELIATGEQSGTWGDTTNTNLSLIDVSLDGQVSITLSSAGTSGSPNTLDIQDGTASNGRNRFIIFNDGGDLGSSAFVQLTPNDAEKIAYIRNNLSGSRSILVFQGTYNASNDYEIPSGTTAIIYFNGAGAGAVAANVFNNAYFDSLRLGSVSVTAILDEDNMASDSATSLATQQSIKAYVDSSVTAQDLDFAGGTGTGSVDLDSQTFTIAGTANEIETSASGQTLTVGLPDNVTITGDLTVDTNTLYVDSTNDRVGIGTTSPANKLEVTGAIVAQGAVTAYTNTGLYLQNKGSSVVDVGAWRSGASVAELSFSTDSGSDAAPVERMRITSAGNVGIGTTSPTSYGLEVVKASGVSGIRSRSGSDSADFAISGNTLYVTNNTTTGPTTFWTNSSERMRITSAGNVGIGTNTPTSRLEVTDETDINMNSSGTGHLEIDGNGYNFAIALNASGANLYTNSASRSLIFGTDETERMRIDGSGNVGIGRAPNYKVDAYLSGSGSPAIASSNDTIVTVLQSVGTSQGNVGTITSHPLVFLAANSEKMRITSSSDVLVGKTTAGYTTPGVRLAGQGFASNFAHNTSGSTNVLFTAPVSQAQINFYRQDTGAGMGSITNGATNSVSYNTSSDYRLKEDWQPMSGSVDRVKALNPVNFAWKVDGSRVDGFLAHEAQTVVPEAVTGTHNELDNKGNPVYQGIDQSKLVPLLTAALQEAITKIETLEARVTALES